MANLRSWKKQLKEAIDDLGIDGIDTDHSHCPKCDATMDFHGHDASGDFEYGMGYWECNSCGFTVTEKEL